MIKTGFLIGALVAMTACGGDDDGGGDVTTNPASASTANSNVTAFTAAIDGDDGATAASGVFTLNGTAQSILTPAAPEGARLLPINPAAVGTCECSGGSCTFEGCGDGSTYTIDGTITTEGDTYTVDLTMAWSFGGTEWTWLYDGGLTVTDTSIDGSFDGEGSGTFTNPQDNSEFEYDYTWGIDWNAVELDTSGCAVGGTLDASVDYSVSGAQGGGNYSGSGTVTFGPTCGAAS